MASVFGLKLCFVGIKVVDNSHQLTYCREQCIHNTTEQDKEQIEIIKKRADIEKLDTVCHYYITIFFPGYESLQKTCCDPFKCYEEQVFIEFNNFPMNI